MVNIKTQYITRLVYLFIHLLCIMDKSVMDISSYPEVVSWWVRTWFTLEFDDSGDVVGGVGYLDDRADSDWHIEIEQPRYGHWVAEAWSDPNDNGSGESFVVVEGKLREVVDEVMSKMQDSEFLKDPSL